MTPLRDGCCCESNGWIPTRSATPSTALVPQRKVGFPIPNPRLLLGFQGIKTARREGISSPFSDARGCTSLQNSGKYAEGSSNIIKTAMTTTASKGIRQWNLEQHSNAVDGVALRVGIQASAS